MLLKASKFFIYCAIASPLIVNRSFFFPFVAPKALFFRVALELALLAFGAAVLMKEISWSAIKTKIKNPLFIAVTLFTALFLITSFTAINPSFAFWSNFERGEGGWQMLHYFLFFCLLSFLFSSKQEWRRLIGWQVLVSMLVGLYAIGQALNWSFIINPSPGAISGTLGNPSYLGGYMLFNLFFALWLAINNQGKTRWFWLIIALFELSIFIAAKTRGSFAALGAGIILMAIFWIFQNRNNKQVWGWGIALIITIFAGTTLLVNTIKGDAWKSFAPRLWTWQSAAASIAEKPIFGWGIENFPFIFDQYYNPRHDTIQPWFDRAHNAILEYGTSGGIPLAGAYLALFYMVYRAILKTPKDRSWPIIAALPAMYLVNGLVLFEILPLYLILFLYMAFANGYARQFSEPQKQKNNRYAHQEYAYALIPLIVIIALSLYYTVYLPFNKNKLIFAALQTNNRTDKEIFTDHEKALAAPSPIGQQETLQNLLAFTEDYFKYLIKNNLLEKFTKEKRQRVMDLIAKWYEQEKDHAIGARTLGLYATALLTEITITNNREYLARADVLIAEGAKKAPARLEFVRLELVSATLQKDKARYERAVEKGKRLRPDLVWEKYNTEL